MKKRDFRAAFGKPDADFVSRVQYTLRRLREEEERPVKRKLRLSAAIAVAACLIVATAALAAASHWGLFDFLNQGGDSGALPEAAEIVATDPPQEGGEGNWLPSGCAKPYTTANTSTWSWTQRLRTVSCCSGRACCRRTRCAI